MNNIQSYNEFLNEGKLGRALVGVALGTGLLMGSPAIGQTNQKVGTEQTQNIPKIGDNTIIIKNITDSTAFIKIKKILITNGYKITESDASIGYLTTDFKPFEGTMLINNTKLSVTILIEENTITMYGDCKLNVSSALVGTSASKEQEVHASQGSNKKSGITLAFNELIKIAEKISNGFNSSLEFTNRK